MCVAAAVLFGAVSCQKDAPAVDNTPSVISPDDGTDEEPEPDPSELLPIKIDADFQIGMHSTRPKLRRPYVRRMRNGRLSRR